METVWLRSGSDTRDRDPPELPGFERDGNAWQLRVDYYQQFIVEVTGVELTSELSTLELKTIQSRLEGCIETYEREGRCMCDEFSRYEYVDSIETVHGLARFFRALVTARIRKRSVV